MFYAILHPTNISIANGTCWFYLLHFFVVQTQETISSFRIFISESVFSLALSTHPRVLSLQSFPVFHLCSLRQKHVPRILPIMCWQQVCNGFDSLPFSIRADSCSISQNIWLEIKVWSLKVSISYALEIKNLKKWPFNALRVSICKDYHVPPVIASGVSVKAIFSSARGHFSSSGGISCWKVFMAITRGP